MVKSISQLILVVSIGEIYADYKISYGYYLVEFTSLPFTLQENMTIDGKVLDLGKIVVN